MNYKYIEGKSFWYTNFEPKLTKLEDDYYADINSLDWIDEYNALCVKHQQLKQEGYNVSNTVSIFFSKLGLFLSVLLLFIPFYWAWKSYKKLMERINAARQDFSNIDNEILEFKYNNFDDIKPLDFFNNCYKLLKIKQYGPLTEELLNQFSSHSLFDIDCYKDYNPMNTSWSVWNDKVINIDVRYQQDETEMREYSGNTYIPVYNGEKITYVHRVAYYTHPFHDICNYATQSYSFMKSCSNLEFKFIKSKSITLTKNHDSPLENKLFDKKFKWDYNDPSQFRMLFTPHKQELFVNEYLTNNSKLSFADELNKEKSFLFNNYSSDTDYEEIIIEINNEFHNFKYFNDIISINHFFELIINKVYSYIKKTFNLYKHLWTTPIMYSEEQKYIISKSINKKTYCYYLPHYLINHFIDEPFIRLDSSCFNSIDQDIEEDIYKKVKICNFVIKSKSYRHITRTTYVDSVPIEYIDCVPEYVSNTLYFCCLDQKQDLFTSILNKYKISNVKADKLIEDAKELGINLYYDNDFILASFEDDAEPTIQEVYDYIYDLFTILKKFN